MTSDYKGFSLINSLGCFPPPIEFSDISIFLLCCYYLIQHVSSLILQIKARLGCAETSPSNRLQHELDEGIKFFSCCHWCKFGAATRAEWACPESELCPLNNFGCNRGSDTHISCKKQQNFEEVGIVTLQFCTVWEKFDF